MIALQAIHLWVARDRTIALAEQRAASLATVLTEYVRGSLAVFDTSLAQLAVHSQRIGGPAASREVWDPILAAALASLPVSGSVSVADAEGTIRHSTLTRIVGESRRDNYVFTQLASLNRDELVVDRPYMSVTEPKQFIIPLGRRLQGEDGRFAGAVVATLIPEAYRQFFRTIDVGAEGAIWVFHPDGVVLFREPSPINRINAPAADNPIVQASQTTGPEGIVTAPIVAGGPLFVSAYRSTTTPAVTVAVSLSRREVLADWRREAQSSIFALAALTFTLMWVMVVAFRQMDARSKVERELEDVQRIEATRLRHANERLEEALGREQRARREAEAASYLKDEFLMTVSHELRTPLNAIYGWVRILATGDLPPEQRARALATVERNARAQTRLIDDLLDVSRAISGRLRLDSRPVYIADVAGAAVDTLRPALEAKSLQFECAIEPGLGAMVADPDRLQQILWNLLSNAIKFTPDGGSVRLRIARVFAPGSPPGGHVEIVVSDTGVGIAPDFLEFAFDRFRQAEAGTRRRFGGLGLGLAIVRHLVELHGGTVRAESPGEGQGATFTVLLPVRMARHDPPAASRASVERDQAVRGTRLDGVRALVVDDEPDARELLASVLEGAGAVVHAADSAAAARRLLREQAPDVLICDIEIPGEDGYQLVREALADPGIPPFVAVAVTADARAVDHERAAAAGFALHVSKPLDPAELVSAVLSIVRDGPASAQAL